MTNDTTPATPALIKLAIEKALRSEHVRKAGSWDRGGVALELARNELAGAGLTMPGAQFDEDTIEIAGLVIEIR